MRIELTKQEVIWLAALAKKEKLESTQYNKEQPSRVFELRRDNMADIENKLNAALQRQVQKERNDAR